MSKIHTALIRIINGYGPVRKSDVDEAARKIGVFFSKSFYDLLLRYGEDGGHPEKDSFVFKLPGEDQYSINGAAFLWFSPQYEDNIVNQHFNPPEYFPQGLVAFGNTGGGDYICFDYRSDPKTDNPSVVYWAHEFEENEGISFLAKDFDAFLDMLMSDEEAEAAMEKLNNKT